MKDSSNEERRTKNDNNSNGNKNDNYQEQQPKLLQPRLRNVVHQPSLLLLLLQVAPMTRTLLPVSRRRRPRTRFVQPLLFARPKPWRVLPVLTNKNLLPLMKLPLLELLHLERRHRP